MGRINNGPEQVFYDRFCNRCEKSFKPDGSKNFGKRSKICMDCRLESRHRKVTRKRPEAWFYLDRFT